MIETACQAGVAYAMARAEALQGAALDRLRDQGITVSQLPRHAPRKQLGDLPRDWPLTR